MNHGYYPVAYIEEPYQFQRQRVNYKCEFGLDGSIFRGQTGCKDGPFAGMVPFQPTPFRFCQRGHICVNCPDDDQRRCQPIEQQASTLSPFGLFWIFLLQAIF